MRESRLQFTDKERNDLDSGKAVRKAEQAAAKADKAQENIPTRKILRPELKTDNSNGKIKVKLHFEETQKKPSSRQNAIAAPGAALRGQFHRQMEESKEDNVGVEAADGAVCASEQAGSLLREAHHQAQLQPYRASEKAERQLKNASLHALEQQAQAEHPTTNPVSRWRQKQQIKKQYAAAKAGRSTAGYTSSGAKKATQETASTAEKAMQSIAQHKKGFLIVLLFLLLLCFLVNTVSSCSVIIEGVGAGLTSTSYPSSDDAMLGAEQYYCALEAALQRKLDRFEIDHDYDEYTYDLDEIEHDPYVLISMISALHPGEWTLAEVTGTLDMLFQNQYTLTVELETEIRYRDADTWEDCDQWDDNAESYESVSCSVTLENFDLSHLPVYVMDESTLSRYAIYMATLGNRPDLFPDSEYIAKRENGYTDYDIPAEALADETFAAMIHEAEKYLGYPYIWGGSNPSTSFDCSGFVCWVLNKSGWSVGRTSAQGLYGYCTPVSRSNARPGDLIFFKGTYDTPGISHVGIYVGNNRMIHCGDPISYTAINTQYWQSHFYAFGRLPR